MQVGFGSALIKIAKIAVLLILLLGFGSSARAQSGCDFNGPLDDLMGHMRHAAWSGELLSPHEAADLSRYAAAIEADSIHRELQKHGLADQMPHIDRIVTEARRIAGRGQVRHLPSLQRQISRVDKVIKTACDAQPKGFFANLTSDLRTRLVGITSQQTAGSGESGRRTTSSSLWWLAGSIALAVGFIAVLFAIRYAYAWIFSIIFNRRSCRIRVALELETDVIDGFVTIIGMKGCRFKPINEGAFDRLVRLIEVLHISTDGHLVVGKHRIPAYVFGLYNQFSVLYFEAHLPRSLLAALLKTSSISPQIVPKSTPRRNVSRRRVKVGPPIRLDQP